MPTKLSLICATLLLASACDESRMLAEDVSALDGDASDRERAELQAADVDPEEALDRGALGAHVEAPDDCGTFFEHAGYGGARQAILKGDVGWIGGPWNDRVSSLKVKSGCVINAYEHVNFDGAHASFAGNVPWVGDAWNDKISSYTCKC